MPKLITLPHNLLHQFNFFYLKLPNETLEGIVPRLIISKATFKIEVLTKVKSISFYLRSVKRIRVVKP